MLRLWKRLTILIASALFLVFSQGWSAEPPVHNFHCSECHLSGLTITELGGDNVCLKCHSLTASDVTINPGAPEVLDGHTDSRFSSGDASNAFGHGTGQPTADQTSHNWAVASDILAAAGAQAPARSLHPEFYSRYGTSVGRITCSRCHLPHGDINNPQLLVKGSNSAEAMCRACHLPWDQKDNRGLLTHPLANDYSAKASASPDKYRSALVNKENADIRLVDGGVSCTSCHGLHFADSDAATIDGPTTLLNKSDGKLLRGDGPEQADKSSLCQTCHTYLEHGDDSGEKPGCLICHSGHSYDPAYPNYFVLRKSANTTTFGTVTGLDYSSPGVLDAEMKYTFWNDGSDATANGYCEKCHGDARDIGLGAGGYHVASAVCTDCHKHDSELGGFTASCGACHGNSATQQAWPDGIANNDEPAYSWADEAGSHAIHVTAIGTSNASCATCHPGNPPKGHLQDDTTGFQQAEVTRMDVNDDNIADYWRFEGGALSGSGAPVYIQTETGSNDIDATYRMSDNSCVNVNCHGNSQPLQWGTSGCLSCHAVNQGNRAAVVGQFAANSHHIQGSPLTAAQCYQCHWEANSDGSVNPTYHGGIFKRGSAIDLVIYGPGSRPSNYSSGTTAIQYLADGSRVEITSLNDHCLGCHNDQNDSTVPFGDGKTPKQFAWDGTSVASRYSQTGTTVFGKYTGVTNAAKKIQTKAYSAHGNATLNEGGWSTSTGVDGTLPNTRNGSVIVACYDCHNSHGSSVEGKTTSYNSTTMNGGILKDTQIGSGGYSVAYQPVGGGQAGDKNLRNPGASLCMDCHSNADGGSSQPWGYQATFGATAKILGYYDTPYFNPGYSGTEQRYSYRQTMPNMGGHFGASSPLGTPAESSIRGLCTPCHDPHGVSPTLGSNQQYGVPLLKGTWLTSPYKEDAPPQYNYASTASPDYSWEGKPPYPPYRIDQNTFGGSIALLTVPGISQGDSQFAGLCLSCHPMSSLTKVGSPTPNTWKSKERIHESVKSWKTSPGFAKHNYSCSKCHSPHNSSTLPRLMTTNCLDWTHKGRVSGPVKTPVTSSSWDECGSGSGRIPGVYSYDSCEYGIRNLSAACHETKNGHSGGDTDQSWNLVTPWEAPIVVHSTSATNFGLSATAGRVKALVNWRSNIVSNSAVDYGLNSDYGQTVTDSAMREATGTETSVIHSLWLTNLSNHETYHVNARSTSYKGQEASTGDWTFYISIPPSIPVPAQDDIVCATDCSIDFSWTPSTDVDGGTIEYAVQISRNSSFTDIVAQTPADGWVTTSSWTSPVLANNKPYYWRIRSRDAGHLEAASAWSAADRFVVSNGDYPDLTLISPALNQVIYSEFGAIDLNFEWSSLPLASQYYVEVSADGFATTAYSSGWIATTYWTGNLTLDWWSTVNYSWRVKARAVSGYETDWTSSTFTLIDTGSCPFLFTWDGDQYVFEADLYGAGKLALKTSSGYLRPEPNDYYILKTAPALKDGHYDFRLVEERFEADYLDELKLYALDVPEDKLVYAEKPQAGSLVPFTGLDNVLHTVSTGAKVPMSVIHVNTGTDITDTVATNDESYVTLNDDRNIDFTYQTLELDLGNIQLAPQVKIVMDAMSMFPNTAEGTARSATFGPRTKLQVQDASGNWVSVSSTVGSLPKPPEFSRPYLFDISNIWISDSRKVRFTFLFKTYVDWILVDTTADVPITITEVPMVSANLNLHGIDPKSIAAEVYEYVYSAPNGASAYLPGNYTRFGDVMPLLSGSDDKFVIYGGGDEIAMTFSPLAPPADGLRRSLLFYTNGYYKDVKVDVPHTVEPLPFASMSNFPYDTAVEHYPDDEDHEQYRTKYNTRVVLP